MSKRYKQNVSLIATSWTKCEEESVKLFARQNPSGYIQFLINKEPILEDNIQIKKDTLTTRAKFNVSISSELWDKCLSQSLKVFTSKKPNGSGYIQYLIDKEPDLIR